MNWQQKVWQLMGQPIGVSFKNGQGTSGVLCDAYGGQIYVMEYLYQAQFALKHYDFHSIQDINPFPHCPPQQGQQRPYQPLY
ncbi:hypothetical protein [Halalkalibacter krulwichiae]|uniref:Uncharacterized protein n=1 Tax=Halalkalibacter krulwichiae TaxID=199441 RepID=A0A1X9MFT0_9BACI|nr:hypothetical protein [Halalkalibacter krulwichiae]ARK32298.1 hypothetical protein BkAM31D_21905 [Halalkalibacter krulwichiae]